MAFGPLSPSDLPPAVHRDGGNFLIGLTDTTEIAAEPVFVQLLVRFRVPKPTIIRADFIREHDLQGIFGVEPAEFEFEIDQTLIPHR